LHVPSPDWRDQVIYFVMTDRFADGNPRNNDQRAGEFGAGQRSRYNGGDLVGLTRKLDYIRGLGATAVWITPPVANQWANPSNDYYGYHGYWAQNFMQVDAHLGSLADYQRLSHGLHRRGMYLVQDIVVNHTGNYFSYGERWQRGQPAEGWEGHTGSPPVSRPTQKPFDQNDPRDPRQRKAAIYHWTPDVKDYNDKEQELDFQMSMLDDLNTENPVVRRALRQSYGHWLRKVGVDAFRVDTAFYVPPDYFADFMDAKDARAPGMNRVARQTGRRQFHVFGEGFGIDRPGEDKQTRKIESYMTGPGGKKLLPGMLNFPLYGAFNEVFARGRPPVELGARITAMMKLHRQPHLMPSFVDNHDVDRFLVGGNEAALRQALLAMFTLPGIPVIYYGTEQGFTEQRASMFATGWGSGGKDRYDTQAPLYRAIADMATLRRRHPVLSRGAPTVLRANAAAPGVLAWTMAPPQPSRQGRQEQRPGQRQEQRQQAPMLVAFNTADSDALLDNLQTGFPEGSLLKPAYGLQGLPEPLRVGSEGRLSTVLPARSGRVWVLDGAAPQPAVAAGPAQTAGAPPTLAPLPVTEAVSDFLASGSAPAGRRLQLVLDGELATAQTVQADAQGRWQAQVDTASMIDPGVMHSLTLWDAERGIASESRSFRVQRQWLLAADVEDPAGDDSGPSGAYQYPTDPSWGANRQMDLRRVRASTSGGALRLDLQTTQTTHTWNPSHGFDHVLFTVFIELPGVAHGLDSATVMPLQNSQLPEGMRWHLRLRVGGWSNALFSARGASADHEGSPAAPGASIQVDRAQNKVSLSFPAAALGRLPSLSGAKVYVTTWDYDGGYRAIGPTAQGYSMGGGPAHAPKVMDSSAVIRLP